MCARAQLLRESLRISILFCGQIFQNLACGILLSVFLSRTFGFSNESQDVLERLTHKTGGHVEYPLNSLYKDVSGYLSNPSDDGNYALTVGTGGYAAQISNGIIKAVGGIGGEITTQYILRYKPDYDAEARPKTYRKITVDIPGLPNVKISARDGYYPNEMPAAAK